MKRVVEFAASETLDVFCLHQSKTRRGLINLINKNLRIKSKIINEQNLNEVINITFKSIRLEILQFF